jgi:hypothetical protein
LPLRLILGSRWFDLQDGFQASLPYWEFERRWRAENEQGVTIAQ